jgi:integrase
MGIAKKCRHARAGRLCRCAWWCDVRVDGKRFWRNLGRDEREAKRLYRLLMEGAATGVFPAAADGEAFDGLAERWFRSAQHRLRASTIRGYRYALGHAVRYFGPGSVARVTPAAIAELEASLLAKGLSPGYVLNVRKVVLHVLGFAVDDGLLAQVPSMRRHPISDAERAPVFLDPAQMAAVIAAAEPRWRALIETGWLTGLRPGELVGLAVYDVDDEGLHVRRTWNSNGTGIGPVKTKRSRRTVHLSARARAALARAPLGAERLPLTDEEGGPLGQRLWPVAYRTALGGWHAALAAAGLAPVGLHALRHSNVALRIAAGQDVQYLADQLGHASASFTLKVYGHLLRRRRDGQDLDAAAARLTQHDETSSPP